MQRSTRLLARKVEELFRTSILTESAVGSARVTRLDLGNIQQEARHGVNLLPSFSPLASMSPYHSFNYAVGSFAAVGAGSTAVSSTAALSALGGVLSAKAGAIRAGMSKLIALALVDAARGGPSHAAAESAEALPLPSRPEDLPPGVRHAAPRRRRHRLLEILDEFLRSLYDALRSLLRVAYLWAVWGPVVAAAPFVLWLGLWRAAWLRMVREALQLSGPAFIKVGQWAATRHDVFPPDVCRELEHLHSRAPTHPFDHTRVAVERSLGRPLESLFTTFERRPIASGSIGQIHVATLSDTGARLTGAPPGMRVAVKVRHPGVETAMERDFALIRSVAAVLELVPGLGHLRLGQIMEQFGGPMRDQIDFEQEARHLARFGRNFRGVPSIIFPSPLYPLISKEVLTETFEEGHLISYHLNAQGLSENPLLARIGHQALLRMMVVDNYVHSDLHPGNILVRLEEPDTPMGRAVARAWGSLLSWEARTDDKRVRRALALAAGWLHDTLGQDLVDSRGALLGPGEGEGEPEGWGGDEERRRSGEGAGPSASSPGPAAAAPAAPAQPPPRIVPSRAALRHLPDSFGEGLDLWEQVQVAHQLREQRVVKVPRLLAPRIVLLDTGMALELTGRDRDLMREMFKSLYEMNGRKVGAACLGFSGDRQACSDPEAFLSDIESIFERLARQYEEESKENAAERKRQRRRSRAAQPIGDGAQFPRGRGLEARGGAGPGSAAAAAAAAAAGQETFSSGAEALQSTLDAVRRHGVSLPGHICSVVVTALVLEGWAGKLDERLSVLDSLELLFDNFDYGKTSAERISKVVDRIVAHAPSSVMSAFT